MAANVRDPAFWRRFSMAVHLEEDKSLRATSSASSARPDLKHSDSWLERQQKKRKRVRYCCAFITFIVLSTIAGIAVLIWWLVKNDWFMDDDEKDNKSS